MLHAGFIYNTLIVLIINFVNLEIQYHLRITDLRLRLLLPSLINSCCNNLARKLFILIMSKQVTVASKIGEYYLLVLIQLSPTWLTPAGTN